MTARPALDAWIARADAALDELYRAEQRDLAARVFDFAAPVPPRSSGAAGEGSVASPANLVGDGAGSDAPVGRVVSPRSADHSAGSHVRPSPTLLAQLRRIRLRVAWRTAGR